jgi:subtilisin family serine protease
VRRALSLLLALVPLALAPAASAQAWQPPAPSSALAPLEPVSNGPIAFPSATAPKIVIGVAPGADLDAVAAALQPYTSSLVLERAVGEISLVASNGAAVADIAAHDPRIAFAQPQRTWSQLADPADAVDPNTGVAFDWQYDAVNAGPALAAVGGGSSTPIAIVDSGLDTAQPDLAGRPLPGFDATGTDGTVADTDGHGTFVTGLIAMVDGNGIGGKGIGGTTPVLPVRATIDGQYTDTALITGITWAADHGAGVINLSLGGPTDDPALDRAIDYATSKNVLVVASAGNSNTTQEHDQTMYPAAYVGGSAGGWSIGLSVGATMPNGQVASFSTHNSAVSIAAPGAGPSTCELGVYSTIPVSTSATEWDDTSDPCNSVFSTDPANPLLGRFAYGQGTSFSAPIVSAVAALARKANPRLTPAQVADVLRRSAHQTTGTGWNEYTGAGVVDAAAAVSLAALYDTAPPVVSLTAAAKLGAVQVDLTANDVANAGEALAGGVTLGLETSTDGVTYSPLVLPGVASIHQLIPTAHAIWVRATVCDADRNCAQQVVGPTTPLVAPGSPVAKVHSSVHLHVVAHKHRRLSLRLALGSGVNGKAVVQVESWTGKTWRAFDRVSLGFGKSRTITKKVAKSGRYKLRARVMAGPSFLGAVSGPVSLRVR